MISTPLMSLAVTVESVPNPRRVNEGWVSDTADILNASTENKLNQIISQLEAKNGTEIAVVTVPKTTPSETPKAFATQLFNYWKIGKATQNNGVLFLISKGDRRVEIETGLGIEHVLPNAQVSEMIQRRIVPPFKQGNFDQGTLNGTTALITALETKTFRANSLELQAPNSPTTLNTEPSSSSSKTSELEGFLWVGFIFVGALLLLGLIALANNDSQNTHNRDDDRRRARHDSNRRRRSRHYPGLSSGSHSSSSFGDSSAGSSGGNSGGSSGGSSGGDFGGGSSGGGGAGGGF